MSGTRWKALFVLSLALLAACQKPEEKKEEPGPAVEGDKIVFAASGKALPGIVLEPVRAGAVRVLKLPGRLVWNEDRTARVFAPFAGRVTSIVARPGDGVKPGQTLAVLAAPELGAAQAEARKADQDYALAQKTLARIEELHKAGVAPEKDLQGAQADLARSSAERSRTFARLKLYGKTDTVDQTLRLATPIAGVVVERNLNPGQEVRPDQSDKALFVVSDPARLWFLLDVAEKDVAYVTRGTEVSLSATSLGEERVKGRIAQVADFVDPQSRSVKVRGALEKADGRFKAEMYVIAEIHVPAPGGFLVPARAVYLKGEQHYVFVDQGNGRYARRAIRRGPLADGYQVVLTGLAATDKVVVEGSLLLERLLASKD